MFCSAQPLASSICSLLEPKEHQVILDRTETSFQRNLGIDFLRIFSMYMVVILHILGRGGVLSHPEWMSKQYIVAWGLETASYCAVNCFALISGYVGYSSRFRWSKLILLWLQVLFFSLGITIIFAAVTPDVIVSPDWLVAFFPVTMNAYWYISSYVATFLLMPFLNIIIQKAERKQVILFATVALVILSIIPTLFKKDPYIMNEGYSAFWLCTLYVLGGWIKKHRIDQTFKKRNALVLFGVSSALALLSKLLFETINANFENSVINSSLLITYTSPFIIFNGIALLCFFAQTNFKSKASITLIKLLSPSALGVYLIHTHPLIWRHGMNNAFVSLATLSPFLLFFMVLGCALAIYLGCTALELLRLKLFSLLNISKHLAIIDEKVEELQF